MGYENINMNAENVAYEIYKSIGEKMPSQYSLLKWIEENFDLKIEKIIYKKMRFGFSGMVHNGKVAGSYWITINSNDFDGRQRFTFCHEIAHIIRNRALSYGFSVGEMTSSKGLERFCDHFAAAYLMPKDLFIEKWKNMGEEVLFKKTRMAQFFKVSGNAVHFRAVELGLIK